jgi:hypothetical protein
MIDGTTGPSIEFFDAYQRTLATAAVLDGTTYLIIICGTVRPINNNKKKKRRLACVSILLNQRNYRLLYYISQQPTHVGFSGNNG